MLSILIAFAVRCLLVGLFLPFSALDKVLNFDAAVEQAAQAIPARRLATIAILCGLAVEIVMSLAILTGIADRLAAFILGGYCIITALLWKKFWKTPDFRLKGKSQGRELFWDFLKNFALAGGFFVLAFGSNASSVEHFIANPFTSSHPYTLGENQ